MNCLAFRRLCLADPGSRGDEFLEHRRACSECARFAASVDDFDDKLRDAMRVPVPEDLEARIKLRQVIGDESARRRARPWQYALAASVLVTVVLSGLFGWQVHTADRDLAALRAAVLQHIKQEPQLLSGRAANAHRELERVLAAFGATLVGEIAPVNYAEICPLKDWDLRIAHTVFTGRHGAISVLYVRGDPLAAEVPITDAEFQGVLVPVAHGNMAVVGVREERLDDVVRRLQDAIVWEI